jgi:hypothetical protein
MYEGWVQNMNVKSKRILFVGIGAMFWSIWLSRNWCHLILLTCRLCLGQHTREQHGCPSKRKMVNWPIESASRPHVGFGGLVTNN